MTGRLQDFASLVSTAGACRSWGRLVGPTLCALACAIAFSNLPALAAAPTAAPPRTTLHSSAAPVLVNLERTGQLAPDATALLVAALDANPGRLVALDLTALNLMSDGSAAGQEKLAKAIKAAIIGARKERPGAVLAVAGLPVEKVGGSAAKAHELNARYSDVLALCDAIVLKSGFIGAGARPNEAAAIATAHPETMHSAGQKAVVFKSGEGWKSRLMSSNRSAPKSSTAPAPVGAVAAPSATDVPAPGHPLESVMQESASGFVPVDTVIDGWGAGGGAADLNGDGAVNGADLAIALTLANQSGGNGTSLPPDGGSGSSGGPPDPPPPPPPPPPPGDGAGGGGSGDGGGATPPNGGGGGGGGESVPVLVNGTGFTGPTPAPPQVGAPTAPGFSADAIARWSVVPFQLIKSDMRIGVVAFHRNGIDKVSFSANNGPWVDVTTMSVNPSTGIAEYFVMLKPADFPDGKVEVRAIVTPKTAGTPRILGGTYQTSMGASPPQNGEYSFCVWTNANGTLDRPPVYVSGAGNDTSGDGSVSNPFLTLSKAAQQIQQTYGTCDGATIYCLPGDFSFQMKWGFTYAKADERLLTIAPSPGVSRDQVKITAERPKTARVHLQNITIGTDASGNFYTGYSDLRPVLWLDQCSVTTVNGRYGSTNKVLNTCATYLTESAWFDAPDGPLDAVLVRNSQIDKLKSDMVSGCQTVINVQGTGIDPADTGAHPDIYQIYRPGGQMDNHIIYGLRAKEFLAQGIFIAELATDQKIQNSAFVNVVLDAIQSNFTSQLNHASDHLLLVNCTFDQTFYIRTPDFVDVSFVGNIFRAVTLDLAKTNPVAVATIDWQHNHFVDSTSYGTYVFGTDVTTGPAPVVNWVQGDFEPLPNSILTHRLQPIYTNHDVVGVLRAPMTSVGALEDQ